MSPNPCVPDAPPSPVDQSPEIWKLVERPLSFPPLHEQVRLVPEALHDIDGLVGGPYGFTIVEVDTPWTDSPFTVLIA